jgi:hypothetical protein
MSVHQLLPLAVNSKSEQSVDLLPPLGLDPATFDMPTHLSDLSAKFHFFLSYHFVLSNSQCYTNETKHLFD